MCITEIAVVQACSIARAVDRGSKLVLRGYPCQVQALLYLKLEPVNINKTTLVKWSRANKGLQNPGGS